MTRPVHFHDGPWHGRTADLDPLVVLLPMNDAAGAYVRHHEDLDRMDWTPDYPFEQIVPATAASTATTEGP